MTKYVVVEVCEDASIWCNTVKTFGLKIVHGLRIFVNGEEWVKKG